MAPWIEIAGRTLLHFVWQGTAIAAAAAIGLRLLRASAPHVRYALAAAAMAAMLVAPAATAVRLSPSARGADLASSRPVASVVWFSSDVALRDNPARTPIRTESSRPAANAIFPAIVVL